MKTNDNVLKIGSEVQWKWMGRFIQGLVKEVHNQSVSKTLQGKTIRRNGSVENPAYLLQSAAGNYALKLGTELVAVEPKKSNSSQPKMFSH